MHFLKFDNGFELIFKKQKGTGVCALFLGIKSGSFYETRDLAGISHFIEHLLFKRKNTAKVIESLGGYLNAYTSLDETVFYITLPSDNFKIGLKELFNLVFTLNITHEDIDIEKNIVIEELKGGKDNPFKILYEKIFENVFKGMGYEKPVIGYENSIKNFTYEKVFNYYLEHYNSTNAVLVVVGDLDQRQVIDETQKLFISIKPIKKLKNNYEFYLNPTKYNYVPVKTSFNQYYLSICFKIPEFNSKDFLSLDIFSNYFGSGESSILTKILKKEKQIVDEIVCDVYPLKYSNLFLISAVFSKDKSPELILKEIFKLIEVYYEKNLSLSDIEKSVYNLKSQIYFDKENASEEGRKLIFYHIITGNYLNEKLYLKNITKITPNDIKNSLKKWIKKDFANITILFPENVKFVEKLNISTEKKNKKLNKRKRKIYIKLNNGIQLIFEKISRTPLIAFKVGGLGGLRFENRKNNGISYFTAKYLTKGTKNYCENEIFDKVEGKGGELFAFSGRNSIGVGGYLLKEDFLEVFDIVKEIVLFSQFPENKIERIKNEILNKIKSEKDNPYEYVMKFFYKNIFKNHHYQFDVKGNENNIKRFKVDDAKNFYKRIFIPENLVFSFAGDLKDEYIEKIILDLEGTQLLKRERFIETKSKLPILKRSKVIKERLEKNQAHIVIGFLAPSTFDDDYYSLKLIKHCIGNQSGRLFNQIREKLGLCYAIFPFYLNGIDGGCFGIYIATDKSQIDKSILEIDNLIKNISKYGFLEEEINNAKNYIIGNYKISKQKYITVAGNNFFNVLYNLGLDYEKKYLKKIKNLNKNKIDNVFKKYFNGPKLTLIMS